MEPRASRCTPGSPGTRLVGWLVWQTVHGAPPTSPNALAPGVVAMICELRRTYPRGGAQRIAHEIGLRDVDASPSRSSVHRILVRHGLVAAQQQNHQRKYRRWQRDAPMQLWQLDIMGGVFLADGRKCKLVTGIDDHLPVRGHRHRGG